MNAAMITVYLAVGSEDVARLIQSGVDAMFEHLLDDNAFCTLLPKSRANQVARDWIAKTGGEASVIELNIAKDFLGAHAPDYRGENFNDDIWIERKNLHEFCRAIVGPGRISSTYRQNSDPMSLH